MEEVRTMEESHLTGMANTILENNLSSVKIIHNSKGTNWEVKVKHEDPFKAMHVAEQIDDELAVKYAKVE